MHHIIELAFGWVIEDGTTYVNELILKELEISPEYIKKEKLDQLEEIRRRASLYCSPTRILADCNNISFEKTVILTDDGAARGGTIIGTARWIRTTKRPPHFIIAVPIIPKDTLNLLKKEEVDHIEVISSPLSLTLNQ